jgi:hypothetical protein
VRERRNMKDKSSGAGNNHQKKWVYYDALECLIPHLTPRKTTSNFPETVEENITSDAEDSSENSPSPSPLTTEEPPMDSSLNSNIKKNSK